MEFLSAAVRREADASFERGFAASEVARYGHERDRAVAFGIGGIEAKRGGDGALRLGTQGDGCGRWRAPCFNAEKSSDGSPSVCKLRINGDCLAQRIDLVRAVHPLGVVHFAKIGPGFHRCTRQPDRYCRRVPDNAGENGHQLTPHQRLGGIGRREHILRGPYRHVGTGGVQQRKDAQLCSVGRDTAAQVKCRGMSRGVAVEDRHHRQHPGSVGDDFITQIGRIIRGHRTRPGKRVDDNRRSDRLIRRGLQCEGETRNYR